MKRLLPFLCLMLAPFTQGAYIGDSFSTRPNEGCFFQDDFMANAVPGGILMWDTVLGAGGTIPTTQGTAAHPGMATLTTGGGAADRAMVRMSITGLLFGGSIVAGTNNAYLEWLVQVVTLSTAAQEYILQVGFIDTANGDQVDGVYFEYDRATSGDVWRLKSANNSVRTTTVTAVPVTTSFVKLSIQVDSTATTADFFINGVKVGSVAGNIPGAAGRETGIGANFRKTVGTTGAAICNIDYMTFRYRLITRR